MFANYDAPALTTRCNIRRSECESLFLVRGRSGPDCCGEPVVRSVVGKRWDQHRTACHPWCALVASEGAGIVSDARCTSELTGEEPNCDRLPARRERGRGAPGLTCSGVARARRGPGEARYRTVFRDRYMGIPANRSAWAPPSMTRQARTAG